MAVSSSEVKISADIKDSQDKVLLFSASSSTPKPAKKDFQLSNKELRELADAGDPSAQFVLGRRLWIGTDGCTISPEEGQKWIIKAAQSKATSAGLCAQGFCFEQIATRYNERAKECYKKSQEQGYIPAMLQMGVILLFEGVTAQSPELITGYNLLPKPLTGTYTHKEQHQLKQAANLFTICAEAVYTPAYNFLADCYVNGYGVQENKAEAFRFFKLGADSGDCAAKRNLGLCYENGWTIATSKSKAKKLYKEAATQGYSNIKNDLGRVSTCIIM